MSTKTKFYWLWAAIGLLLCLNVATVGWVIRKVDAVRNRRQNPEAFVVGRLGFSPQQVAKYQQSREQMRRLMKSSDDSLRLLRSTLLRQISQPAVSDGETDRLLRQITRQNEQVTRLRFQHWRQVRALCTPAQQARFDKAVARIEQEIDNPDQTAPRARLRRRF